MGDIIVDTVILVDILIQFDPKNPNNLLEVSPKLDQNRCKLLNSIIEKCGDEGYIVASTFAFVEISNKFEAIFHDTYDYNRFKAFIKQPPEWFLIENLDLSSTFALAEVPKFSISGESIEVYDAIHVATALIRGSNVKLATTDQKLHDISVSILII